MTVILTALRLFFGGFFTLANFRKWFGFLLANWKEVIVALVACVFLYQMFSPVEFLFGLGTVPSERRKFADAQHTIVLTQAQLATCQATNTGLASAITDQNNHIKGWGELSQKLDASTAKLVVEISKSRAQSKTDVAHILSQPTPKTCTDALQLVRDAVKSGELQWKK